jgi:hypothetical protein
VTDFPRNGIRGRFHAYFGRPRLKLSALRDSLRFWTKDRFGGVYDLKIPYTIRLQNKPDAIFSREYFPSTGTVHAMYWYDRLNPHIHKKIGRFQAVAGLQAGLRSLGLFDTTGHGYNTWCCDRQAFVRPGWRVLAKNIDTDEMLDLGFIDADADNPALEDVFLPDGDYEISVLTSSLFWQDCLEREIRMISVRAGEEVTPLPVIYNLRSSVSEGVTTIRWSANRSELEDCVFGIWYSPVPFTEEATNGSDDTPTSGSSIRPPGRGPDATVWYFSSQTEYATTFSQNAPAWVTVAALRTGDEYEMGKVYELYLDWSNVPPRRPDDVMVLDELFRRLERSEQEPSGVRRPNAADPYLSLWNG